MNDPNYHPMISRLREILMVDLPSDAIVAGGCLRDCILGGIPKDVDVFVGPGMNVPAWAQAHGGNCWAVCGAATEYDMGLQASVAQVFDTNLRVGDDGLTTDRDGPEIQFIQMKRPTSVEEQFARFDFDFCKLALLQDGSFKADPTAYPALRQKVARWTLEEGDVRRTGSVDRVIRWLQRPMFRSWRFVMGNKVFVYHPSKNFALLKGAAEPPERAQ